MDLVSFAKPILINMENRPERLRDSMAELSDAVGRPLNVGAEVELIRPKIFDDAAGFTNAGFRSNFDAHLRAAYWARDTDADRVLVLEDDLSFGPGWPIHGVELLERLETENWQLASLGYLDAWGEAPKVESDVRPHWVHFTGRVNGAHSYFLHRSGIEAWIEHLEAVVSGTPGDQLQGPMASDGAINTFAWVNPHVVRLLAVPNMVGTRPTRSDITPAPVDRLPVLGGLAEQLRSLRRRYGAKATNFD